MPDSFKDSPDASASRTDELMSLLSRRADEISDGHFTVCKFTTNWRVAFFTPNDMSDISFMEEGATFEDAACRALARFAKDNHFPTEEFRKAFVDNLFQS